MVKAIIAGILMGVGASLAGGCNVGGFYNAIGNLAANGFAMWLGLVFGVILGLKLLYLEMEHIEWGAGGAKTLSIPTGVLPYIGIAGVVVLLYVANVFSGNEDDDYIARSEVSSFLPLPAMKVLRITMTVIANILI